MGSQEARPVALTGRLRTFETRSGSNLRSVMLTRLTVTRSIAERLYSARVGVWRIGIEPEVTAWLGAGVARRVTYWYAGL